MLDNYPPNVNVADPNAPWNRADLAQECNDCIQWMRCPCCGEAGYCSIYGEWTTPDKANTCDDRIPLGW